MDIPSDGVITGHGKVNGRTVCAFAQDFTARAGTLGEMHAKKICKVMDLALKSGVPLVGFNDSGGARIQEGVDALFGYGEIFFRNSAASGVIPQIACIMGPTAGGAVYSPAMTDWVFMVKKSSFMFITGPDVIKAVTHEDVTMEELGGAETHNTLSGVAHFAAENEEQTFLLIRELLSFIPDNNMEDPPERETSDPPDRMNEKLNSMIPDDPNHPYDIRTIIREVLDDNYFFEVQEFYAKNIVIGFGRLEGKSVAIRGIKSTASIYPTGHIYIPISVLIIIGTQDTYQPTTIPSHDVSDLFDGTRAILNLKADLHTHFVHTGQRNQHS